MDHVEKLSRAGGVCGIDSLHRNARLRAGGAAECRHLPAALREGPVVPSRRMFLREGAAGLAASLIACNRPDRDGADASLVSEISRIRAIDNHAHPVRVVLNGPPDREFDARMRLISETSEASAPSRSG